MTNKEIQKISQAIKNCQIKIVKSFDNFNEDLRKQALNNLSVEQETKLDNICFKKNPRVIFDNWVADLTLKELNDYLK